jgi:hypothetical protein
MLSIYLDDCADSDTLAVCLRQAGHRVVTPRDAGNVGIDDPDHLAYAAQQGHVLLTHNCGDFQDLHDDWQAQGQTHAGIFLVYRDNDVRRDPTPRDLVRAIARLLASGLSIANECHVLNHWR